MKCRHKRKITRRYWVPIAPGLLPPSVEMTRLKCLDCGAWPSLGPSADDDERVRIEIRAAEIAASGQLRERCELCGWQLHRDPGAQHHTPAPTHNQDQFHAGWLARVIATHDEECRHEFVGRDTQCVKCLREAR